MDNDFQNKGIAFNSISPRFKDPKRKENFTITNILDENFK